MRFKNAGILSLSLFFLFTNAVGAATTTAHIFDPYGNLLATREGDGVSTSTYFIHTDHLGSPQLMSDEKGVIQEATSYYPYGAARVSAQNNLAEQRKFTGHEYDEDSDLTYAKARYYNQSSGQFLSRDPIANLSPSSVALDPQQLNTYSYSRNNPINLYDPSGLLTVAIPGTFNDSMDKKETWAKGGEAQAFLDRIEDTFGDFEKMSPNYVFATENGREHKAGLNDMMLFPDDTGPIGSEVCVLCTEQPLT